MEKEENLKEFKALIAKYAEKDFSSILTTFVGELLDKNCLPVKVNEDTYKICGDLENQKNVQLYLKDNQFDRESDLHQMTLQLDYEQKLEYGTIPVYEDRVITELRNGGTRIEQTDAHDRLAGIGRVLNPIQVERKRTYEFDSLGNLTHFSESNGEKQNTVESSLDFKEDGTRTIGVFTTEDKTVEYETDRALNKEDLRHMDIQNCIKFQMDELKNNGQK